METTAWKARWPAESLRRVRPARRCDQERGYGSTSRGRVSPTPSSVCSATVRELRRNRCSMVNLPAQSRPHLFQVSRALSRNQDMVSATRIFPQSPFSMLARPSQGGNVYRRSKKRGGKSTKPSARPLFPLYESLGLVLRHHELLECIAPSNGKHASVSAIAPFLPARAV